MVPNFCAAMSGEDLETKTDKKLGNFEFIPVSEFLLWHMFL